MEAIYFTKLRQNLASALTRVCDNHEPMIVTRRNAPAVVMMSLDDFNSYETTRQILSNPINALHLLESIKQYEQGNYFVRDLIEVE